MVSHPHAPTKRRRRSKGGSDGSIYNFNVAFRNMPPQLIFAIGSASREAFPLGTLRNGAIQQNSRAGISDIRVSLFFLRYKYPSYRNVIRVCPRLLTSTAKAHSSSIPTPHRRMSIYDGRTHTLKVVTPTTYPHAARL